MSILGELAELKAESSASFTIHIVRSTTSISVLFQVYK